MLVDLIEVRLSCLDITDREDHREMLVLRRALQEVNARPAESLDGMEGVPPAHMLPRRGRKARARYF
ncbi:MAG: hypothetical protein EBZ69_02735 [Alphaproteobacteria bacterium]|nr:hypothetical protein [Alphaproteobacteria bacterium]NDC55717.1 hypothetical protein [Alphaproteobacteria bacterium]